MKTVRARVGTIAVVMLWTMGVMARTGQGEAKTSHNDEFVQRTDADTPWVDADAAKSLIANLFATKYRVIAYNADGKASDPSAER
jgi:hypothetical protein